MQAERPRRLWLPLLILKTTGKLVSKTKFQKIAFLTQYESKIDDYNFKKHYYGPYSASLALDVSCYTDLIEEGVNISQFGRRYYTYSMTDKGIEQLTEFEGRMDAKLVQRVTDNINKFKDLETYMLLEEVYSKFALKEKDSAILENEVTNDLITVKAPIQNCYMNSHTRQLTFVLAILEIVEKVFSNLKKNQDTVQRGVIFNISKEIIHKCKEMGAELFPPVDSDRLRPVFLELDELEHYLVEYCDARGIMKNPYLQPLEEIITEDEANRLAKALLKVKIPI